MTVAPTPIVRLWEREALEAPHVWAQVEAALRLVDRRTRGEMLYCLQRLRQDLWREPLQAEQGLVRAHYNDALQKAQEDVDRGPRDGGMPRAGGHSDPTAAEGIRRGVHSMRLAAIDLALTRLLEDFGFVSGI